MRKQTVERSLALSLTILSLLLSGMGCQKDEPTTPTPTTADVSGQVMHHEGVYLQYVIDARVELGDRFTTTSGRGEFTITSAPFGHFQLRVEKDGFADYSRDVNVERITPRINIFMTKQPNEYRDVNVHVQTEANQRVYPVARANVSIDERTGITDETGDATITEIPYGERLMRVQKVGFAPIEQTLEVGSSTPPMTIVPLASTQEERITQSDVAIPTVQLLNRSDLAEYRGEMTEEEVANLAAGSSAMSGSAKIIGFFGWASASPALGAILGRQLHLEDVFSTIGTILQGIQMFILGQDVPSILRTYEQLEPDGITRQYVVSPVERPVLGSLHQTMTNKELLTSNDLNFYEVVARAESPDDLQDGAHNALISGGSTACMLVSWKIVALGPAAYATTKIVCGAIGAAQIADAIQQDSPSGGGYRWDIYKRGNNTWDTIDPAYYVFLRPIVNHPPDVGLSVVPGQNGRNHYIITCEAHEQNYDALASMMLYFGDGTSRTIEEGELVGGLFTIEKTYTTTGVMNIRFIAKDTQDVASEANTQITVTGNTPPASSIECPSEGSVNEAIHIVNDASDDRSVTEYRFRCPQLNWDTTKTTHSADVYADQAGAYDFYVQAKDDEGAWGSDDHCVVNVNPINNPPTACFTYGPSTGDTNTTFTFTSCSYDDYDAASQLEYLWSYDGIDWRSTGHTNTTDHRFTTTGEHLVWHEVRDSGGLESESINHPVVVTPINNPSTVTRVTPTPITKDVGEMFTVEWQGSDPDAGDTVVKYHIHDSVNQTWQDHYATSAQLRYDTAGSYWFEARAFDNHGLGGAAVRWDITIGQTNHPPVITIITPTPITKNAGEVFMVEWLTSDPDAGDTVPYCQIRDCVNQTWQNHYATDAQLRYDDAGDYWFETRAVDSHGLEGAAFRWVIHVLGNDIPVIIPITTSPVQATVNVHVAIEWSFIDEDDGIQKFQYRSSEDIVWHDSYHTWEYVTFTISGEQWYEVRGVDMADQIGEPYRWIVNVTNPVDPLSISFSQCPGSGQPDIPVHFEVSITGGVPPYHVRWQPMGEDPQTLESLTFEHPFPAPMSTYVNATAIDSRSIEHGPVQCALEIDSGTPTAEFSFVPTDPHVGDTVDCNASVTDDDTPLADLQVRWQWEAGGIRTEWSTTKTASHVYTSVGTKHVTLDVKDKWGNIGSVSHDVNVQEPLPPTGTIIVTCNIDQGSWTIQPGNRTGVGTYREYSDVLPGTYTITWGSVTNYDAPSGEQKTLVAGGTITFNGHYSYNPPHVHFTSSCPGPWTLQQPVDQWLHAEGGEGAICYSYSGAVPDGTSFSSDGHLTGTPGTLGNFSVTFHAKDCQVSSNDDYLDCVIVVQNVTPVIEIWPTTVDCGTDLSTSQFHVARTQGYMPIHCTIHSDNSRVTTYPESEMYTDGYVNVTVNRDGQLSGYYSAVVTVSPDGGEPKTCTIYWSVGACPNYYPELIAPIDGETVSRANLRFQWECSTAPCGDFWLAVFDNPNDDPIMNVRVACDDTSFPYYHDSWHLLQTYHTYYWGLALEAPNHSISWESSLESFYVVP